MGGDCMGDMDEIVEQTMKALRKEAADRYFGTPIVLDEDAPPDRAWGALLTNIQPEETDEQIHRVIDKQPIRWRARMYKALYDRGMTLREAEKILGGEKK